MPAGAVSPAQPVTGPMVAKAQPRPDRRRLSSGLSAGLSVRWSETKERNRGPLATKRLRLCSYSIHLSATAVPALRAGRPGLVSGGNRASGTARVRSERG